jgi:hypothetical protein
MDLPTYMLLDHTPKLLPSLKGNGKRMFDWKGKFLVSEEFPQDLRLNTEKTTVFGTMAMNLLENKQTSKHNWQ